MVENADEVGVDADRVALGGDSAGANLAAVAMSSWQSGRWTRERSAMLDTLTAVWRNTLEADRAV